MRFSLVVSRVPLGPQNIFVDSRGGGQGLSRSPTLSPCLAVGGEEEKEVMGGQIFFPGDDFFSATDEE